MPNVSSDYENGAYPADSGDGPEQVSIHDRGELGLEEVITRSAHVSNNDKEHYYKSSRSRSARSKEENYYNKRHEVELNEFHWRVRESLIEIMKATEILFDFLTKNEISVGVMWLNIEDKPSYASYRDKFYKELLSLNEKNNKSRYDVTLEARPSIFCHRVSDQKMLTTWLKERKKETKAFAKKFLQENRQAIDPILSKLATRSGLKSEITSFRDAFKEVWEKLENDLNPEPKSYVLHSLIVNTLCCQHPVSQAMTPQAAPALMSPISQASSGGSTPHEAAGTGLDTAITEHGGSQHSMWLSRSH